ncbi:type III secretion system export apparatus subunit SctV [Labrys sp. LIt4]|uniref:type III secretion system export apparatus subunit SctV n=1 Tax=Labrys sp. LIt4 TaxID=2821355 RepID=UPI001ADEF0CD|nr:type III secretion system export apparatus subunit SctV [Labrys sp. LIt4]MBP0581324.1 type III secretion system export apparatus subunit SctV [Labrys sp. LIt4]
MTMPDRILTFLAKAAKRADLVIAIMMLVAVIMMLIPLPTELVDVLITINIAISVLVLLAALYVTHPLDFSSLPSVILVATLFRLAITITTTRLILLQADAGQIITAFGTFVVGGSIAVGLVVFLIITIAQFLVIAKGAERVAEVAARFTLDALPGKQMSIDAELRNGDIDKTEARRLRQRLERESQLFGAMDGAMKFVKGDVIAGIVIILVNLIGGIAVGTLQHGMSMGVAASTYALLTVGDGLVAQIPALLVAVASGTMITRVAGADGEGDLGGQIAGQLLRDSRTLGLAAVILAGLSLVPGFPTIIFLILAAILGAGAYALHRNAKGTKDAERAASAIASDVARSGMASGSLAAAEGQETLPSTRILVRYGKGTLLERAALDEYVGGIRQRLYDDLGVELPRIGVYEDPALPGQHIRIDVEEAPVLEADLPEGRIKVEGDAANLALLGLDYEERPAGPRENAVWVDAGAAPALAGAGLASFGPGEVVGRWAEEMLKRYAGHFVGIQETRALLSEAEEDYGELVREAREAVPLQKIAEVLRRLVAENVPIRNLRIILEALVEAGGHEQDPALLAEHVRVALKRQISFRAADRNRVIAAYVMQPSAEELLRAGQQSAATGGFAGLPEEQAQSIVAQIGRALRETAPDAAPVILAAGDVRRHMRAFLAQHGIELAVLSYQELAPEFNVQPLATITSLQGQGAARPSLATTRPAKQHEGAA